MKAFKFIAVALFLISTIALCEDFKTVNGKEYKDAKISRVESDGIVVTHSFGVAKIPFNELPRDLQDRFHYNPAAADRQVSAGGHRATEEKAVEKLNECERKFEAIENAAVDKYRSSAKGTLSGQAFVATKGRENVKLGAMQVLLFARDAIDALLPGLKAYADFKLAQSPLNATQTATQQAEMVEEQAALRAKANWEAYQQAQYSNDARNAANAAKVEANAAHVSANAARERYADALAQLHVYTSAEFYFIRLQFPIQTTETDADGRFTFKVPQSGEFVIAAHTQRKLLDETETYYWLQPVSLRGTQQQVQNLSNNNLTTTLGTSSLIHTID
jgi:hypothetical protein